MKIYGLLVAALLMTLVGCAAMDTEAKGDRQDALYACDCGPQCKCNTVGTKPGKCACGAPLKGGHVIKTEGNEALMCTCGPDCQCKLDPNDPTKCGCGKVVKRVDLKGSGVYFCNCGGSCMCNTVSDKPGECKCGMQLKKVD